MQARIHHPALALEQQQKMVELKTMILPRLSEQVEFSKILK